MGIVKEFYTLEQIRKDLLLESAEMGEVKVTFVAPTDRAILIHQGSYGISKCLPKSQIFEPDPIALNKTESGEELVLVIPLWLIRSNKLRCKERR